MSGITFHFLFLKRNPRERFNEFVLECFNSDFGHGRKKNNFFSMYFIVVRLSLKSFLCTIRVINVYTLLDS